MAIRRQLAANRQLAVCRLGGLTLKLITGRITHRQRLCPNIQLVL
jgi:hypothetical protein